MPRLQEVGRTDGVEAVLDALAVDGAVIVRDFLDPEVNRQFRADMEAHAARHRTGSGGRYGFESCPRMDGRRPRPRPS